MTEDEIKARIVSTLPRDLLIDLLDTAVARARQAHELIRDNTDLTGRGARGLEGQARFRIRRTHRSRPSRRRRNCTFALFATSESYSGLEQS